MRSNAVTENLVTKQQAELILAGWCVEAELRGNCI